MMVRNKQSGFPGPMNIEEPRAKAEFSPKRADLSINTKPQERMRQSNKVDRTQ